MDINIDPNNLNLEQSANMQTKISSKFLEAIPLHDISKVFVRFNRENRTTIIPIGFPGAGKSLFLSSLFRYAQKGKDPSFSISLENNDHFLKGRQVVDQMITYFDSGKLYDATRKGTLDLVGLTLIPTHPKLDNLKLGFLDLAGEDIANIKISNKGDFTQKINAVFNGLKLDKSPIIFTLITPFTPREHKSNSQEKAHQDEDILHFDFLNFLSENQPEIFENSKFFIIVSQWDKNKNPNLTVESYISENRPSVYGLIKNKNIIWGEYSIGSLLETTDENKITFQELVIINHEYPQKLWNMLYKVCTNNELNEKSFWQKLFS